MKLALEYAQYKAHADGALARGGRDADDAARAHDALAREAQGRAERLAAQLAEAQAAAAATADEYARYRRSTTDNATEFSEALGAQRVQVGGWRDSLMYFKIFGTLFLAQRRLMCLCFLLVWWWKTGCEGGRRRGGRRGRGRRRPAGTRSRASGGGGGWRRQPREVGAAHVVGPGPSYVGL